METLYTAADIEQSMADLNAAIRREAFLKEEWFPYLQELEAAKERVENAKTELLEMLTARDLDFHADNDFDVSVRTADRGAYDYEKLPAWVRQEPGVCAITVTVDKKAIEKLTRRGRLTEGEARAAWVAKPVKAFLAVTPKRTEH